MLESCNFTKKETLVQVFSCEFLRTLFSQNTSRGLLLLLAIQNYENIFETYGGMTELTFSETQLKRLVSLHRRAQSLARATIGTTITMSIGQEMN